MDLEMENLTNIKYNAVTNAAPRKGGFNVTGYILKLKLAKDEAGANKIAAIIAVLFFILTIACLAVFVFDFSISKSEMPAENYQNSVLYEIETQQNSQNKQ